MKPGNIIELTNSQTKFIDCDDTVKAVAFVAGFGSGKTFVLVLKMIIIKLKYPQADVLYLTPVFSMMRDILIPTLEEILLQTTIGYKINRTTGEIIFDKGGRIIIKSMDDPSKIIGMNVCAVFLDELDTLPTNKAKEIWIKAIARARKAIPILDKDGNKQYDEDGKIINIVNQLFVATTPEGFRFVYDRFKKNKPDNYVLIQASTRENTHLPSDFVENLEAIYPKELVSAYLDGDFINMTSGTVFKEFNRIDSHSDATYRPGEDLFASMDFNVMNCNTIIYVKRPSLNDLGAPIEGYAYNHKPTLVAVKHFHGIKDTPGTIEVIQEHYVSEGKSSMVHCFPDSSGQNASSKGFTVSDISLLKKAGFKCKYPKRNPKILDRVLASNSAFQTGLVKVNTDLCPDLTDALEQQIYDPKTELPEKASGASIDDITDAATYIIHYMYSVTRKTLRSRDVKS